MTLGHPLEAAEAFRQTAHWRRRRISPPDSSPHCSRSWWLRPTPDDAKLRYEQAVDARRVVLEPGATARLIST